MTGDLSETVLGLYRRYARHWDKARCTAEWNDRGWIEAFVGHLAPGSSVLDLGCGGGEPIAKFMVSRGLRITGVDGSADMIALARERLPDQEWIFSDMRELDLGRQFQGILAWDSYFHLPHEAQREMFSVFDSHAEGNAVLMFNTGPQHGEAESTVTFPGERLYHASLAGDEYRSLLARHHFDVICHAVNDNNCGGRTVWLCKRGASSQHS